MVLSFCRIPWPSPTFAKNRFAAARVTAAMTLASSTKFAASSRHLNAVHRRLAVPLPCVKQTTPNQNRCPWLKKRRRVTLPKKKSVACSTVDGVHVKIRRNINHEYARNKNIDICWLPFTMNQTISQSQVHQHQSSSLPVQTLLPERPEHVRRRTLVIE